MMDSEIPTDQGPANKPQNFGLKKPKMQKSMALTTAKTNIFNKHGFWADISQAADLELHQKNWLNTVDKGEPDLDHFTYQLTQHNCSL